MLLKADKAVDQMGVAETYADYKASKLDYGESHLEPVVKESSFFNHMMGDHNMMIVDDGKELKKMYRAVL